APLVGVLPVLRAVLEMAADVFADQALPAPVAVLVPREPDELHAGAHDPRNRGRREGEAVRVERVERALAGFAEDKVAHPAELGLRYEGHPLFLVEAVGPVA